MISYFFIFIIMAIFLYGAIVFISGACGILFGIINFFRRSH